MKAALWCRHLLTHLSFHPTNHSLLQFCLLLFRTNIGSRYRQSPIVPAVPFIHNSMVTYDISRMWHPPSSRQVKRPRQQPFTWRSSSFITTPVYPSCFLFITNVNLNAFTLGNGTRILHWLPTLILCSKAPISSNTILVKSDSTPHFTVTTIGFPVTPKHDMEHHHLPSSTPK